MGTIVGSAGDSRAHFLRSVLFRMVRVSTSQLLLPGMGLSVTFGRSGAVGDPERQLAATTG